MKTDLTQLRVMCRGRNVSEVALKKMGAVLPLFFLLLSFGSGTALARDSSEEDKIRFLISSVESLEGAVFIRNGAEHKPGAAAGHLRLKLRKAGDRVRTADDFIRLCGSRSSLSGDPYRIRFKNNDVMETEVFFRRALKSLAREKP